MNNSHFTRTHNTTHAHFTHTHHKQTHTHTHTYTHTHIIHTHTHTHTRTSYIYTHTRTYRVLQETWNSVFSEYLSQQQRSVTQHTRSLRAALTKLHKIKLKLYTHTHTHTHAHTHTRTHTRTRKHNTHKDVLQTDKRKKFIVTPRKRSHNVLLANASVKVKELKTKETERERGNTEKKKLMFRMRTP